MDKTCGTCRWWTRRQPRDVIAEFEANPLPMPRSFFDFLRWLWNPQQFKLPPDDIDMDLHDPSPVIGWCRRTPTIIAKHERDFCGEHSDKDTSHG